MNLSGARIILTGAASGIGKATLHELSHHAAHIVAVDRDAEALSLAVDSAPATQAHLLPLVSDLSEQSGTDRLFSFALEQLGGVDIFIANAGFAYYEAFGSQADVWSQIERIYRVNVFAPLYALAKMRRLNAGREYGFVITASAQAKIPVPGYATYASTKAALDAFASAFDFEKRAGEHLMLIYPVSTRTRFFDAASAHQIPVFPPSQQPEQVARALVRGIQRNQRHIYPSRLFSLGWMVNRFLPGKWAAQRLGAYQFQRWLRQING